MNWRQEAIVKLRDYEARRQSLENIPQELKRLKSELTNVRSLRTDAAPASGGGNRREDALLDNIVRQTELERALRRARAWVRQVDAGLAVLDDDERIILERFYIYGAKGAAGSLCEQLNIERSTVYRKRDNALRRFTIALYGVLETE